MFIFRYLSGISIIFCCINSTIFAQKDTTSTPNLSTRPKELLEENFRIFFKNGIAMLNGDLDQTKNKYVFGFGLEKRLNKNVFLGISVELGSVEGSRTNYNFTSKSNFSQVSVFAKTDLVHYFAKSQQNFEVNLNVGIGIAQYDAISIQNGKIIRYLYGSENAPGSVFDFSFLYGVECNYLLSKKVKIGIDFQNNYIQSDRFDAIVNNENGTFGYTFLGMVKDSFILPNYKSGNDIWKGLQVKITYLCF